MQNIVSYIVKNWDILPKSRFNDLEVVIFNEIENSNEGYGHHTYEGYGVDKNGNVNWCYSSGCSCTGTADADIVKDLKVFTVKNGVSLDMEVEKIKFSDWQVIFENY